MSPIRPDRALRRAATQLARLHPDDLASILDALEPAERERMDLLLGMPEAAPAAAEAATVQTYEGVSPWLRVRIEPSAKAGRASREFVLMTEAAQAALLVAAAPFRTERVASGPGRSLVGQIWQRLSGRPA